MTRFAKIRQNKTQLKSRLARLITGLFLLAVVNRVLAAPAPEFRGYTKSFFSAFHLGEWADLDPGSESSTQGIVQNRFRMEMLWEPTQSLSLHLAYDVTPTLRSQSNLDMFIFDFGNASSYRIGDLDTTLVPGSGDPNASFSIAQNLDRLSFSFAAPSFDLHVGRQAIAFGAARTINPTDVLAPFRYEELDKEERTGVDAIRIQIPLGEMSELDSGLVFGEDGKRGQSAAFARIRGYWRETDFSLITMGFQQNFMLGCDLSRAIGGAGFVLEAAYTWDTRLSSIKPLKTKDYARISIGLDTNFSDGFYGSIEYHFNGAGKTDPAEFLSIISDTAYTEGGVFLFGKHYLSPSFSYQITPLWILNCSALANLSDPSALFSPCVEYNPKEDVYLQLGAHISLGNSMTLDFQSPIPSFDINSEFGLYPDLYFTSMRIYF